MFFKNWKFHIEEQKLFDHCCFLPTISHKLCETFTVFLIPFGSAYERVWVVGFQRHQGLTPNKFSKSFWSSATYCNSCEYFSFSFELYMGFSSSFASMSLFSSALSSSTTIWCWVWNWMFCRLCARSKSYLHKKKYKKIFGQKENNPCLPATICCMRYSF